MIGSSRVVRALAQDPADLVAAHDRQVQVQDDEVRRPAGDRAQRLVPPSDDLDGGVARSLERVLDQAGDVVLVFDDEHAGWCHS